MAAKTEGADCSDSGSMDKLDLLLKEIAETKANYPDNENAGIVRDELHHIIQEAVYDLSGKYRLFHNASVQEGGSMIDGTKIGEPDEFDYVVVLPALQEQLVTMKEGVPFCANNYDINMQSTKLPLKIKDISFMDDILCPDWCDEEENKKKEKSTTYF